MAETSPHARCLACAFPFWEQLTPEEQERLCRFTRPVHYAKGARVHSPLESCVGILLLRSGQLRSYLLSEDGRDVTLYRLFGGEVCILSASCVMDAVNIDLYIGWRGDESAVHQRGHLPAADAGKRLCALLRLPDDGRALFRYHVDDAADSVHERRPTAGNLSDR